MRISTVEHVYQNKTSSTKGAAPSGRTRLRKIWSCLECRRRRLHCDRVTPVCGRCKKSEKPETCHYLHMEESTSPKGDVSMKTKTTEVGLRPGALREAIFAQAAQGRQDISFKGIAKGLVPNEALVSPQLDDKFAQSVTGRHAWGEDMAIVPFATAEATTNSGKDSHESRRRQQVGENTSVGSMADSIPGLHDFTKQAFRENPIMDQLRLNMHKMETESLETHRTQHLSERSGLRAYLPLENEADSLVHSYFSSLHGIYDVLDRACFQEVYQAVWVSAQTVDDYSLVVVLLVIAIPMCLQSTSIAPTADGVRSYRDRATTIITACQLYIDQHPSRRYTIEELQAQFLLLWAQQLNARRYKQTYVNAGQLVRTFICTGLHRDNTAVRGRELSNNEKLLRRKIWLAALEFELQTAYEQGMPPASLPLQYDRRMHKAYEDSNMKDGQQSDHPSRYFSSLGLLYESCQLRHRVCPLLNNSNVSMSSAEAQATINALSGHLNAANTDLSTSPNASNIVAVLTMRGSLLALHRRQLQHVTSGFESSVHRAAITEHACYMIETSHNFCQRGDSALECLSNHQIHAALSLASVCLVDDFGDDDFLGPFLRHQAHGLLEKAIDLIQLRVTRFTGDQRQLWTALAAHALVRIHHGDAGKEEALREAVAKYVAAFDGMGLLGRPVIERGRDSEEPSSAMPDADSWVLDDWFDMGFVDLNAQLQ